MEHRARSSCSRKQGFGTEVLGEEEKDPGTVVTKKEQGLSWVLKGGASLMKWIREERFWRGEEERALGEQRLREGAGEEGAPLEQKRWKARPCGLPPADVSIFSQEW